MTGAEIAAIAGAVVWVLERIFSWKHKVKRSKQVSKIVEKTERIESKYCNGSEKTPQ